MPRWGWARDRPGPGAGGPGFGLTQKDPEEVGRHPERKKISAAQGKKKNRLSRLALVVVHSLSGMCNWSGDPFYEQWKELGGKHSCFPTSCPGSNPGSANIFSLLLILWTLLRLNTSSAKQCISQMQLAVMSRAKCYKKWTMKTDCQRLLCQKYSDDQLSTSLKI